MKKTIIFLAILLAVSCRAQTSSIDISEGDTMSAPIGTYIKDMNNTFTPYLGT